MLIGSRQFCTLRSPRNQLLELFRVWRDVVIRWVRHAGQLVVRASLMVFDEVECDAREIEREGSENCDRIARVESPDLG